MKKRLKALLLAGVLVVSAFTGCGKKEDKKADASGSKVTKITIAASPTPHAEILEKVKPILKEQGYDLEIKIFEDYVLPMTVVESGEIDANYAVHVPYLESFNEEQGTHLANAGGIHYEPFGIYPGKKKDLADIAKGDTIAVPNDTTNEARALLLLEAQGLIKLKDGVGIEATVLDIEENTHNIEIQELEAAQVAKSIQDVDFAVINGNYAIEAGLDSAIAVEAADSLAAETYANYVCVKDGEENSEKSQALKNAILTQEVKDYINNTYSGAVVPVF